MTGTASGNDVQQPGRARAIADRSQVDDDGDVLAAERGMPPHMLIDTEDPDTVEPAGDIEEELLAGGQDRGVDGVPRGTEACSDTTDRHPVDHEAFQCPQHRGPRQLRPWCSNCGEVFPPDAFAGWAPVAADSYVQDRRAPTEGDVDEPAHCGPAWYAFGSASLAPRVPVVGGGAAFQNRVIDGDGLSRHGQGVGVEETERVEIGRGEARLVHVEVFRMECVRTSIFRETSTSTQAATRPGRLHRPLHPQMRRATKRQILSSNQ